jgi:lysophospholipase L1-like esterase
MTRTAIALPLLASAIACNNPAQATVIDPGGPAIMCPASPSTAQTLDGQPVPVSYASPIVTGGATPLTGPTCTPASGSTFPQGTTTVSCLVSDAKARPASCTFPVAVLGPPTLTFTRLFAFGDSITAGEIPSEGGLSRSRVRLIDPFLSYPADLSRDLSNRYRTQQPGVVNQGSPDETTAAGLRRLPGTLAAANNYQVMLLMEGANDIPGGPSSFASAVANLRTMIDLAKGAGLRVYLANLPPENASACTGTNVTPGCTPRGAAAPYVAPFNAFLPALAAAEQIPYVDVYAAFNGDNTTLIDNDGLHPTAAGYQVIADTFFKSIEKTLEVPVVTTTSRATVLTLRRR